MRVNYQQYYSNGDAPRGILICGTGVGMSIVANRYKDVRAVLAHNLTTAKKSREHNNSNALLGAWISSDQEIEEMLFVGFQKNGVKVVT